MKLPDLMYTEKAKKNRERFRGHLRFIYNYRAGVS